MIDQKAWTIVERHMPTHYIGLTGPCCDRCSLMLEAVHEALQQPRQYMDNPEMDGTDFAHPAWWRGQDRALLGFVNEVNRILDGTEDLSGTCNEPWQSLRERLFDIRRLLSIAAHVIANINYDPTSQFHTP